MATGNAPWRASNPVRNPVSVPLAVPRLDKPLERGHGPCRRRLHGEGVSSRVQVTPQRVARLGGGREKGGVGTARMGRFRDWVRKSNTCTGGYQALVCLFLSGAAWRSSRERCIGGNSGMEGETPDEGHGWRRDACSGQRERNLFGTRFSVKASIVGGCGVRADRKMERGRDGPLVVRHATR
jgi:hypothetical protein